MDEPGVAVPARSRRRGTWLGILELYRTPSLRDRMSQASLERASRFSWERCTRDTLAAYRSALAA